MREENTTDKKLRSNVIVTEENSDYYAIVTDLGNELIASALASKVPLNLTQIALGDGNGHYVKPDRSITELVHEVWRGGCAVTMDPANENMIICKTNVPVDVGGFTVREIAVLNEKDQMVIFASAPGWRKLNVNNGTSNPMEINIRVTVIDASAIDVHISYDGVSATLKDIENHNNSQNSHGGHFTNQNLHFNEERLNRLRMGTNYELSCEKVGGVFNLTGLPAEASGKVICFFRVPQALEKNDSWTLNSEAYTAKTADGKGLKPSSFVADAILTCVADTQAKELHFSSLGSGGGGTVVSKTPPEDIDVNWFNPDNRLLSVNVSGEWIAIAGVYGI